MAALASYCDARAAGGQWFVRIEDVDEPRSRVGAEGEILAALDRYALIGDEPVVRQSERGALYDAALAKLDRQGAIYACACTRRELETAPLGPGGERVYPGTCRDRVQSGRDSAPPGRPEARAPLGGSGAQRRSWGITPQLALRVRVDANVVSFVDLLQGPQRQDLARDVGDFVVRRADGLIAYQLAVVVDDADQRVTAVVRGADLLASTPRQIHLQRLLGLPALDYLHVPVAINASGEKLSKQTHASPLPDDPVPALLAAWRFLDQPMPEARPASAAEFAAFAARAWSRARLPPVPMLPAPRGA